MPTCHFSFLTEPAESRKKLNGSELMSSWVYGLAELPCDQEDHGSIPAISNFFSIEAAIQRFVQKIMKGNITMALAMLL